MTQHDFDPVPSDKTMEGVCASAFVNAVERPDEFTLNNFSDGMGLPFEAVDYTTPYGDSSTRVKVHITRPSVDATEFLQLAEGTIDEKPRAEICVQAPRSFLFNLANREKYYADKGFFRLVVLSDGTYLDILSIAFNTQTDVFGDTKTFPDNVGSMLLPLPSETDWTIQDMINPNR